MQHIMPIQQVLSIQSRRRQQMSRARDARRDPFDTGYQRCTPLLPVSPPNTKDKYTNHFSLFDNQLEEQSVFRILIHLIRIRFQQLGYIPIRIQGLDDQKFKKIYRSKILDQKLQFTYPQASIKDVQATEEAFSLQKRTSSISKHEISLFFFYFCGSLLPSWIRTPNTDPLALLNRIQSRCGTETLRRK